MSLTKKHFEGIANYLIRRDLRIGSVEPSTAELSDHMGGDYEAGLADGYRSAIQRVAAYLATQNGAFDRERFLTAAGYYPS